MKKFMLIICLVAGLAVYDTVSSLIVGTKPLNCCMAQARNDGSFSKTSQSVQVYNENGHPKGSYAVYLHQGKKYINFQNTWICIQGKTRFSHAGNWYVIK